jgi:hypothetical protein
VNDLASTYVRLVDAAIVEYDMGVAKLQEFWGIQATVNLCCTVAYGSSIVYGADWYKPRHFWVIYGVVQETAP